jgi:twitching motility protein PilT
MGTGAWAGHLATGGAMNLATILEAATKRGASDVHLLSGRPPAYRVNGYIELAPVASIEADALRVLLEEHLTESQRATYRQHSELCLTLQLGELGFFRVNLATHLGQPEAAIRIGRRTVPTLAELGVPEVLMDCVRRPHGLVLITGPTGAGKTTTLNAIIGRINAEERKKIITIEDPVEFIHTQRRSLVVQREIGLDAASYSQAVRHALRQDPDILCIGELRDLDTISNALTAAETGHLVLGTLHTSGAVGTISRIVDVFPARQQNQIRHQLASSLQAVLTQKLLPRADGSGRLLVYELMIANTAIRNLIRDGRTSQLPNVIQTHQAAGMRQLDQLIRDAYAAGEITFDVAEAAVSDRKSLRR